jgi:primosomal protein N' (replication factor Y)
VSGAVWRVLPDVPALDRILDYWAPPGVEAPLGTIVRVPLQGRRVRGWLVGVADRPDPAAQHVVAVTAVVSEGPPAGLAALCEWAAWRWAGPRPLLLRAASPQNAVPVGSAPAEPDVAVHPPVVPPVALPAGPRRLVVCPPVADRTPLVTALLAPEGSTIVVAPDRRERQALDAAVTATGRPAITVHGDDPAAARTAAWQAARRGACVVLGGRAVAFAPVPDLAAVVVLDDADEALVEESAPTWHARDVLLERAARVDAPVTLITPAPTVEGLVACSAARTTLPASPRRGWPPLDVADRRLDPPGLGLLGERLAGALRATLDQHHRSICILNRRGRARLLVCRQCGQVARCEHCGAAMVEADTGLECPRGDSTRPRVCTECGSSGMRVARPGVQRLRDDLAALLPRARVQVIEGAATTAATAGTSPDVDADVVVGTEAALHRAGADGPPVGLVSFLDFDQELLAPRFRAAEQALWLLVRAARLAGARGQDGRLLVQTRVPDHEVLLAATHGDVDLLTRPERERREALALPPFGGLAALSGASAAVTTAAALLAERLEVRGPVDGTALVRAPSSDALADGLAAVDLTPARAQGRLRVEVDPRRV